MKFFYRACRATARTVFKVLYRTKVYGLEHLYQKGAIIAPNHASFYDPPIVSTSWPNEVHFLASDYLFKVPVLGKMIEALNSHPVHRGAADLTSIKKICALLQTGAQVIIFPEGQRSLDGLINPLKQGIGLIAIKSNAAIIPTYVHGTFEIWPPGKKIPKLWGKTAVVFGSPILIEDLPKEDKKEAQRLVVEKLERALHDLKKWYKDGAKGTPP
jgi:1-acyl-sn-glycerol-3-phosphate acyltransferase